MSFHTSIPTQQEIANLPIYDIAMKDWNPQRYYDGMNDDLTIMFSPDSGEYNEHIVNSAMVSKSKILSEYKGEVKLDVANTNYWNDTDHNWNNILSSGMLTTNIKDHLDTKAQIPTKDIDIIVDKKANHVNDAYSNSGVVQ